MRTWKMVLIAATVAALALAAGPAAMGKPKRAERVSEKSYTPPAAVANFSIGLWINGQQYGGASFVTGPGDRYVRIEIVDDSGQPTWGTVYQGDRGTSHEFCDSTEQPIRIKEGRQVHVQLYQGPCLDTMTPAIATTGIVRATFSNLP